MSNMNQSPLLSICIPTYNRAELLRNCLQSICSQIGMYNTNVEIIVSDNNSTDHTKDIVNGFHGYGIVYHSNESNIGANRNILMAAKIAVGDYIWFMGDDDKILPNKITEMMNVISENGGAILFQTNILKDPRGLQVIDDGVEYWKRTIRTMNATTGSLYSYIPAIIVKRESFLKIYQMFMKEHSDHEGDSYSHTYILLGTVYKKQIVILGQYIWAGDGQDHDSWKMDAKKWYEVVMRDGIYKFSDVLGFLGKFSITERDINYLRRTFQKIYAIILIAWLARKFGVYKVLSRLWRIILSWKQQFRA